MRLIINDILTDADKEAIKRGEDDSLLEGVFDLDDLEALRDTLSERDRHFFALCRMPSDRRIDCAAVVFQIAADDRLTVTHAVKGSYQFCHICAAACGVRLLCCYA